jgi:hypothetical protein
MPARIRAARLSASAVKKQGCMFALVTSWTSSPGVNTIAALIL